MMKKRVSIIGYGALGRILAEGICEKLQGEYCLAGIWTWSIHEIRDEIEDKGFFAYESFAALLEDNTDYVVEIAGGQAVKDYGKRVLESKKNLIITSVGALADLHLYNSLYKAAVENECKIHLTSGAVGGFDIFQSIGMMGKTEGKIENFKAPESLNGAPYLKGRELNGFHEEQIFSGNARKAIEGFPQNVNVAVASALASVGVEQMEVVITSCPGLSDNIHKITVKNDSVEAVVRVSSKADTNNPKSSVVTAWSVVALLKNLASPIQMF